MLSPHVHKSQLFYKFNSATSIYLGHVLSYKKMKDFTKVAQIMWPEVAGAAR